MKHVLETALGEWVTPENTVEMMLRIQNNWDAVATYFESVLRH